MEEEKGEKEEEDHEAMIKFFPADFFLGEPNLEVTKFGGGFFFCARVQLEWDWGYGPLKIGFLGRTPSGGLRKVKRWVATTTLKEG